MTEDWKGMLWKDEWVHSKFWDCVYYLCILLLCSVLFCCVLLCNSLFWLSNSIHMNTTCYGVRAAYSIFTALSMHESSDPSRRFLTNTTTCVVCVYKVFRSTSLLIFILNSVNSLYKKVSYYCEWDENSMILFIMGRNSHKTKKINFKL